MTVTRRLALVCAVASAGALAGAPAAGARETLRARLAQAGDGATIHLGPGTFAGPVTITADVTLVGAGTGRTVIRGGGPVVTIGSATSAPTVTLADLTIAGGVSTTDPQAPRCGPDVATCAPGYPSATALGGGIEAFPGTHVTVVRGAVTGNAAVPARTVGSAVATCPGDVPCPASFAAGGGIDNWGTMTLDATTVSGNRAVGVQANGGGIVDEAGATLRLRDATVGDNTAVAPGPFGRFASGGGIHVATGGLLDLERSRVAGNRVELANTIPAPYPRQGGGEDVNDACCAGVKVSSGGAVTVRDSHIDGNRVEIDAPLGEPFGADAALCACDGDVPLTLADSTVRGNVLAVHVRSSADVGASGPGAIEADGDTLIRHTAVTGNSLAITATDGDAGALGAIAFFFFGPDPPATVAQSLIAGNTSSAVSHGGTATVQGAGISDDGPLLLTGDRIAGNRGTADGPTDVAQGAGIWNGVLLGGPESPLTLERTTVTGNRLSGSPGAALAGGGIYTVGFPVTLDDSRVAGNAPDQCAGC
jgi:hypothetical protein